MILAGTSFFLNVTQSNFEIVLYLMGGFFSQNILQIVFQ